MTTLLLAILLVVVLAACWALNLLGLPGNWLMVAVTSVYAYLGPAGSPASVGWKTVLAILVLAVLGEVVEFVAGALGAARLGGSWRGAGMALVGSLIGGVVGMIVGLPIPVIGPFLAAVLLASVGALIGTVWAERWLGRTYHDSWRIGKGAFWGRLYGTLAKSAVGLAMLALVVLALVIAA
jgi:hypothetical protein